MIFILWFLFAIAVAVFASKRGRNVFGWFLLAAVISPLISIIILFLLPSKNSKKCPECKEIILKEAIVCKHCGCRSFEPLTTTSNVTHSSIINSNKTLIIAIIIVTLMVIITSKLHIF